MIIIKFALVFFLVFLTLVQVQRQGQGPLVGGPYYFVEMPDSRNPVEPRHRVNGWQAFHRRNVWRAWFDSKGHPVELKLFHDQVLVRHERLVWDKAGQLKQRWLEPA